MDRISVIAPCVDIRLERSYQMRASPETGEVLGDHVKNCLSPVLESASHNQHRHGTIDRPIQSAAWFAEPASTTSRAETRLGTDLVTCCDDIGRGS